jgi:hypothetical protein
MSQEKDLRDADEELKIAEGDDFAPQTSLDSATIGTDDGADGPAPNPIALPPAE